MLCAAAAALSLPPPLLLSLLQDAVIVRLPGSVNGLDLTIEDLDDCTVYILDHSAQITVDYCNRTKFVIGPVDGPFFMRNCNQCTVTVACRQLRTRECVDSDVFLYCATKSPIIEASSNRTRTRRTETAASGSSQWQRSGVRGCLCPPLVDHRLILMCSSCRCSCVGSVRFHPFNVSYPHLRSHFAAAKLNPAVNHNDLIYDFSANDDSIPRPHSTVVSTVPPLVRLRCFLDGVEIDGDCTDTPLTAVVHPSFVEECVHKTSAAASAATPSPAPASLSAAVAAPVMESFGSNSVVSVASATPAAAASTSSEATSPPPSAAAVPAFEEGVAPSIPATEMIQPTDVSASPLAAAPASNSAEQTDGAASPVATDATAPSSAAVDAASTTAAATAVAAPSADAVAVAAAATPTDAAPSPIVVKSATFSIDTSAADATKALYELAGVAYQEPQAATPGSTAAAASAPVPVVESTPSPVDEDARLAAWFSSAPGMTTSASAVSAEQAALEARVAEAERRRMEVLELRRANAAAQSASTKAAAAASLQEFYAQRETALAEQR